MNINTYLVHLIRIQSKFNPFHSVPLSVCVIEIAMQTTSVNCLTTHTHTYDVDILLTKLLFFIFCAAA